MQKLIFTFLFLVSLSNQAIEISYSLIDLTDMKVKAQSNEETPMVLASVSKLYTMYYALNNLDPKAVIPTEIYTSKSSSIKDGVLNGDLIIRAKGNPFITAQNLIDLIYQVKSSGIHKVKGTHLSGGGS